MKLVIATVAGIAVGVTAAYAENKKPKKMSEAEMDRVYAGAPGPFLGMVVGGENNQEIIAIPAPAVEAVSHTGKSKLPKGVIHPGNVETRFPGQSPKK